MVALGTRSLTMSIDGDDVTAQVSKAVVTSGDAEADFLSFAAASEGGARAYALGFIGVQDPAEGTLWDQVWSHRGEEVACIIRPHGNAEPSPAQPHFEFTAIISEPNGDLLGGEANASATARFTFECSWELLGKPVRVTA